MKKIVSPFIFKIFLPLSSIGVLFCVNSVSAERWAVKLSLTSKVQPYISSISKGDSSLFLPSKKNKKLFSKTKKQKNFFLSSDFRLWIDQFRLSAQEKAKPFYYAAVRHKGQVLWVPFTSLSMNSKGKLSVKKTTYSIPGEHFVAQKKQKKEKKIFFRTTKTSPSPISSRPPPQNRTIRASRGNQIYGMVETPEANQAKEPRRTSFYFSQQCANISQNQMTEASDCLACETARSSSLGILIQNIEDFQESIQSHLQEASNETRRDLNRKICMTRGMEYNDNYANIFIKNLKKCGENFDLKDILCGSCQKNVPPEMTLAIASQESNGKCKAHNPEKGSNRASRGLFQVNDGSLIDQSHIQSCTTEAPSCQIRGRRVSGDCIQNPSCIYNPKNNFCFGMKILQDKYNRVNRPNSRTQATPPLSQSNNLCPTGSGSPKKWEDLDRKEQDQWRKSLAAYNGGEGYVFQAYRNIRNFYKQQSKTKPIQHNSSDLENLSQDWEIRRLFLFRNFLTSSQKTSFFGKTEERHKRSLENAISNLAYTESILGRSVRPRPSLITYWSDYLKRHPEITNQARCTNETQCRP